MALLMETEKLKNFLKIPSTLKNQENNHEIV